MLRLISENRFIDFMLHVVTLACGYFLLKLQKCKHCSKIIHVATYKAYNKAVRFSFETFVLGKTF